MKLKFYCEGHFPFSAKSLNDRTFSPIQLVGVYHSLKKQHYILFILLTAQYRS